MIYAYIVDDMVVATSVNKPTDMTNWKAVNGTLPQTPTVAEGEAEPRLILKDGALVWQVGKTAEEIAEERKKAYTEECDPYLVAYQGYLVEGDEAKAESARKAYLKAKAEVRRRLPYAE